ncbi:YIP1 family protein [Pseudoprimorskyibacter insulae]|uniref:Yip1 domain-containing protein n=1 Tax=Pseudoprimorskyibacter insulae TaxID=1695997 RepID=A0A2R8AXE9_9RHOB|nr:YIP1 family protein [Pseudoprimorskyibacter insulae]SPF80668.1 hypothetical protein PRI8871_02479 [Pseudoprimorskyibacter insulae]
MPVTTDIVQTYRGPGRVVRRLLAMGQREDRALAIVMAACVVFFVARWPALSREAHLSGQELDMLLGGSLLALVMILPLVLYAVAFVCHLVLRALKVGVSSYGARFVLFWALLASSPLVLLNGLVAGFIGPGPAQSAVGVVWLAVFLWFWGAGLWAASGQEDAA